MNIFIYISFEYQSPKIHYIHLTLKWLTRNYYNQSYNKFLFCRGYLKLKSASLECLSASVESLSPVVPHHPCNRKSVDPLSGLPMYNSVSTSES